MGDMVNLCGVALNHRGHGHTFCFDIPFWHWVQDLKDCTETVPFKIEEVQEHEKQ